MNKPKELNRFMYALMKQARLNSFVDFLEVWDISEEDYKEIKEFFDKELEVQL